MIMTTGRIPKPLPIEADLTVDERDADLTVGSVPAGSFGLACSHVRRAAQAYRDNRPGRAEYELVRAGLLIAQAIDDGETADTLADLHYVTDGNRRGVVR